MLSFHRIARHSFFQFSVALVAASSWLSGCGDDEEGDGGGKGGSGVTGGSAGSTNGGSAGSGGSTTGGSPTGGSPTGGSAGGPTGGSAGGPTGGSAGSAGTGMGGEGMGGEGMGGEGMGGESVGGMGMGGEGGSTDAMCLAANLDVDLVSSSMPQQHDHLPIPGAQLTTLANMINSGMPLVFTLPEEGSNPHQHTLTFTAQQLTTLRNGGSIAMITSAMNGPMMNMHTHTYSIDCAP